jgi:modulator of FtsH protease
VTLLWLVGVLTVSVLGLAPQSRHALGVELLLEGVVMVGASAVLLAIVLRTAAPDPHRAGQRAGARIALFLPGTIPFAVGGASLLAGAGGGLYWTLAGIVGAFLAASANAWVLLVEIQR